MLRHVFERKLPLLLGILIETEVGVGGRGRVVVRIVGSWAMAAVNRRLHAGRASRGLEESEDQEEAGVADETTEEDYADGQDVGSGSGSDDDSGGEDNSKYTLAETDQGKVLLSKLSEEKRIFFESLKMRHKKGAHRNYVCRLCPQRAFYDKSRLVQHEAEHKEPHFCTSSKQLKILKAVYAERCAARAADKFVAENPQGVSDSGLLQASADHMRAMLMECPSYSQLGTAVADLDRILAWVLTANGMRLLIKSDADSMGYHRYGDVYYTDDFMKLLLSFCIDPRVKCSTKRVHNQLLQHYTTKDVCVPFLLPAKQTIYELIKVCLDKYSYLTQRGHDALKERNAFRVVSVDAAYKFLLSVSGQPKFGACRSQANQREGVHAVCTCRAIDGAMFMAEALSSENAPEMISRMALVSGVFEQLELLVCDRPSDWDIPLLYAAFPGLKGVGGDPSHVVFAVSSCYGSSMRPAIVKDLRKVMEKWCATGQAPWLKRGLYVASRETSYPLSAAEKSWWEQRKFTPEAAKKFLDNLNPEVPFASRLEYVKSIAAIKQHYQSQLHRPTNDGKTTLGMILIRAVEWKNIEYFANAAKWRNIHEISREEMAHGTVGNEAEHADMKAWAQNIFLQTRERALTSLKAWVLSKILRHESSFYSPKRLSWDNAGCEWLSRVLAKATNPSCRLSDVPPLRRAGFGRSEDLRKPSLPSLRRPTVEKKPALKRPASSSGAQRFEGVWKRPSTTVRFADKWSV